MLCMLMILKLMWGRVGIWFFSRLCMMSMLVEWLVLVMGFRMMDGLIV